ncbi:UNVERIFIED_CONTAM: Auxin-responsive protein IAA31 [Sesamum radiatum]|uniref:Auxin-responsive protein n=1 Tax=Sesamum radiatum TaxID=300843 RepID=A0AAW2TRY2_SESRA
MELELGLGLPNINYQRQNSSSSSSSSSAGAGAMVKGHVDLNYGDGVASKNKQQQRYTSRDNYNQINSSSSSCLFAAAADEVESKDFCNLLLWSGRHPNKEHPDPDRWTNLHLNHQKNIINEEEEDIVMGWPPVNSVMRKELEMVQGHDDDDDDDDDRDRRMRKSWRYVKVKMEGVGIGRKIDVTLYHSYQALTHALLHIMFANYTDERREAGDYAILYQDKQGEWMMLPTDHHHHHILPWEKFVEAVQRLEIIVRKEK